MVERVRSRFGGRISDEEVLLRIMFPEEHVEAMLAVGARRRRAPSVAVSLVDLVRELCARRQVAAVYLKKDAVKP